MEITEQLLAVAFNLTGVLESIKGPACCFGIGKHCVRRRAARSVRIGGASARDSAGASARLVSSRRSGWGGEEAAWAVIGFAGEQ